MLDGRERRHTVVFDLGGVLVGWDPFLLYRTLLPSDEEIRQFFDDVRIFEWNREQDAGRPFDVAVQQLSAEFPHYAHLIEAWDGRWEETITGQIDGTVEILRELRDDPATSLYALTNWSAEKLPIAQRMFGFFDWFDGVVVSGEEGVTKPDSRIYRTLADRFGVDLATSVFIDDSVPNVEAANELGMAGVQFHTPDRLRADLKLLGLPLS